MKLLYSYSFHWSSRTLRAIPTPFYAIKEFENQAKVYLLPRWVFPKLLKRASSNIQYFRRSYFSSHNGVLSLKRSETLHKGVFLSRRVEVRFPAKIKYNRHNFLWSHFCSDIGERSPTHCKAKN